MVRIVRQTPKKPKTANSGQAVSTKREKRPRGSRRGGAENGLAFSTGQTARYCYVTADTILNWIKNGSIKAHRTAGGQYRILASELLRFMREHDMNTELLESEIDVRPHCWEFHCIGQTEAPCIECMVYRSGAMSCFELSNVNPPESRLFPSCDECDYFRRYAGSDDQEE
jgi:excisionase family DNA binding protein